VTTYGFCIRKLEAIVTPLVLLRSPAIACALSCASVRQDFWLAGTKKFAGAESSLVGHSSTDRLIGRGAIRGVLQGVELVGWR
jgi:hypothetical protein